MFLLSHFDKMFTQYNLYRYKHPDFYTATLTPIYSGYLSRAPEVFPFHIFSIVTNYWNYFHMWLNP